MNRLRFRVGFLQSAWSRINRHWMRSCRLNDTEILTFKEAAVWTFEVCSTCSSAATVADQGCLGFLVSSEVPVLHSACQMVMGYMVIVSVFPTGTPLISDDVNNVQSFVWSNFVGQSRWTYIRSAVYTISWLKRYQAGAVTWRRGFVNNFWRVPQLYCMHVSCCPGK